MMHAPIYGRGVEDITAGPPGNGTSRAPGITGAADLDPSLRPIRELAIPNASTTPEQRASARGRADAQLQEQVVPAGNGRGDVELVRIPAGADRAGVARRLEADPAVDYAEPNWVYTHAATSADPYYTDGSLWGMYGDDGILPENQYGSQADEAWAAGATGSKDVYVGVIDEGIQYDHPDLNRQVWTNPHDAADGVDNDGNGYVDDIHGWVFDGNDNTIYDGGTKGNLDDHGTHVSGTIAAEANTSGVVGVNWDVTLISGKFLGRRGGTTANAVKAVDYFTDLKTRHGVNVVATNNSWGGGGYSQALYDAIARANAAGILFVAAAGYGGSDGVGDDNDTTAGYPSNYALANVVAVAAIDKTGALASFSNYGDTTVDLGAPGVSVASTTAYNRYSSYSGMSMATPHVTGAAALYAAANPTAGAAASKDAILSSVAPTTSLAGKTATGGRLDVSGLVSAGSDVTGYKVYRGTSHIARATTLSYSHTAVSNGTTYTYYVTAVNDLGDSGASNTATAIAGVAAARSVTVTAGPKSKNLTDVTVTWVGFTGALVDVSRSGSTMSTDNDVARLGYRHLYRLRDWEYHGLRHWEHDHLTLTIYDRTLRPRLCRGRRQVSVLHDDRERRQKKKESFSGCIARTSRLPPKEAS